MMTFMILIAIGVGSVVFGAHYYGPILNVTAAAVDWVKARFAKKL